MNIQNELGVIVVFAQSCEQNGWKINHIQSGFPDAIIQNEGGDTYRAEFELCSSNFKSHQHDLCQCEVIICWENDWSDCPLTVWSMKNWDNPIIVIANPKDLLIASLTIENQRLKRKIAKRQATRVAPQAIELNERQIAMLEIMRESPKANFTQLGEALKVSRPTATKDARALIAAEKVHLGGKGWKVHG